LPDNPELSALDYALAGAAIEIAVGRHAGTIEQVYTPTGPVFIQIGKDLTTVQRLVVTGGAAIYNERAAEIAKFALYNPIDHSSLRPKAATIFIDRKYILAAMGLLSEKYPEEALKIMKEELDEYGSQK
jgi:uncharacterized protein (TIGR01319 family)